MANDLPLHAAGELVNRIENGEPIEGMVENRERADLLYVIEHFTKGEANSDLLYNDDPNTTVSRNDLAHIVAYISQAEGTGE